VQVSPYNTHNPARIDVIEQPTTTAKKKKKTESSHQYSRAAILHK
jgi:hypothetical protein